MKWALLVVDVQVDFVTGSLAVPEGREVALQCTRLAQGDLWAMIVASQDWHPVNHCSFADPPNYTHLSWPKHCVADTPGAALHADLVLPSRAILVHKGTEVGKDALSAFDGTQLASTLRDAGVEAVCVVGLALDYCVRASALDAVKEKFKVALVAEATRAVHSENTSQMLDELSSSGVKVLLGKEVSFEDIRNLF